MEASSTSAAAAALGSHIAPVPTMTAASTGAVHCGRMAELQSEVFQAGALAAAPALLEPCAAVTGVAFCDVSRSLTTFQENAPAAQTGQSMEMGEGGREAGEGREQCRREVTGGIKDGEEQKHDSRNAGDEEMEDGEERKEDSKEVGDGERENGEARRSCWKEGGEGGREKEQRRWDSEEVAYGGIEDGEERKHDSKDASLVASRHGKPPRGRVDVLMAEFGASAHAMPAELTLSESTAAASKAMPPPQEVHTLALRKLEASVVPAPNMLAATDLPVVSIAVACKARGAAAVTTLTSANEDPHDKEPAWTAAKDCVSLTVALEAKTPALKTIAQAQYTDYSINGADKECLQKPYDTSRPPSSTPLSGQGPSGAPQENSNSFLEKDSGVLSTGDSGEDAFFQLDRCDTAMQSAEAASSSASTSASGTVCGLLAGDDDASRASSSSVAGMLSGSSADVYATTANGLSTADAAKTVVAPPTVGVGKCGATAGVFPTLKRVHGETNPRQQPQSQNAGGWQLPRRIQRRHPRQLPQSQQPERQREQLQNQRTGEQQTLLLQQQKTQQGSKAHEPPLQQQVQHQQRGQNGKQLAQQPLHTPQGQQLQRQRGNPQASRHKPLRLFLSEDYEGPELPPSHPMISLCFGTSSEEEEEEPQQRGAAGETTVLAPVDGPHAQTTPTTASNTEGEAGLLKKKKRERKVSVGATDALWQPHFHPHNQEFRVRYRYKGSMRVKTLSCSRFGREGARRLTAAFVQRWQKSGRRVAAKTNRSKLALSDLPPDVHMLPVYDRKRPAGPAAAPVDKSDSSCNRNSVSSSSATGGNTSRSTSISTTQGRSSRRGSAADNTGDSADRCDKAGKPAAVLPSPSAVVAAQTPNGFGVNAQLPRLCSISQPAPLLEWPPVTGSGTGGASASSSEVSASAASAADTSPTFSHIPAADALVPISRAPVWAVATADAGGGAKRHGGGEVGMMLPQTTPFAGSSTCYSSYTTYSRDSSVVISSQAPNSCGSRSFFATSAALSSDLSCGSPATIAPGCTTGYNSSYPYGHQSTSCSASCHVLHICYSSSRCCPSNTEPWRNCCHSPSNYTPEGMSNMIAMKCMVNTTASTTTATAGIIDAAEASSTSERVNTVAHSTGFISEGLSGNSPNTVTCLVPLSLLGEAGPSFVAPCRSSYEAGCTLSTRGDDHEPLLQLPGKARHRRCHYLHMLLAHRRRGPTGYSADNFYRLSPAAPLAALCATPEEQVPRLLPPTGVQPCAAATAFLAAPAGACPATPALSLPSSAGPAGGTINAATTSSVSSACLSMSPAVPVACEAPGAGCALPRSPEVLVPASVGTIPAAAPAGGTVCPAASVMPAVFYPAAAGKYLCSTTLAYSPAANSGTPSRHFAPGASAAPCGPAAGQLTSSAAEGSLSAVGSSAATAYATHASGETTHQNPAAGIAGGGSMVCLPYNAAGTAPM